MFFATNLSLLMCMKHSKEEIGSSALQLLQCGTIMDGGHIIQLGDLELSLAPRCTVYHTEKCADIFRDN